MRKFLYAVSLVVLLSATSSAWAEKIVDSGLSIKGGEGIFVNNELE